MKSALIYVILYLGCLTGCYSQILNVEKQRLDSLKKPFSLSFESKFGAFNRSATEDEKAEFINFSNNLNAVYSPKKKHAYVMLGSFQFTENNGNAILNNAYLHLRATFNYNKKWSPEVFAQLQDDKFRGLRNRKLAGAGYRWKPIEAEKFRLVVAAGPMYESEKWRSIETGDEKLVELWKLNSYMLLRWDLTENVNFNTIFYYQVGYDNSADLDRQRLSNSTNLNFKISNHLSFTVTYQMAYENEPIFPITEFIYSIENGLQLTF